MDSNSDDLIIEEEDESEAYSTSNNSLYTDPASTSLNDTNTLRQSSISSSDSIFEEIYTKQLEDNVRELKAELQTKCHLDWLRKFEPWEQNPKIELNLLLHGAIRERTLRQLAFSKNIHFKHDESIYAKIFQNDPCLLQRIFQEIVHDQRQQNIIYTEIIFRPDVFNFGNKTSNTKLKEIMEIIIDCIRFFTSTNIIKNENNTTTKSYMPYDITPLSTHIKIILSCNWNNIKNMFQFIRFARDYPEEIVGIDFYGQEDDCRKYWHDFSKYKKILSHYHIQCQTSMDNYKDLQLINDVIKGLNIKRIFEVYEIVLSSKYLESILIKNALHLVICPISNAYEIANHRTYNISPENRKKRKYPSASSLDHVTDEKDLNEERLYDLMNYLQSESINYSITSFSSIENKQQNLSMIYKNLFEKNKNFFTCEHMQWLNENTVKSSFASQKLKTNLMNYIRKNYTNCYEQTILLQQFQETTNKWQQEMNEIIDKNAQIAVDFAKKMHKDKLLKRLNHRQEIQTKLFEEEETNEDSQIE